MISYNEIKKIIDIVRECNEIALKHFYDKNLNVRIKEDYSPVTNADLEISKLASIKLKKLFPNDLIISEENYSDRIKNKNKRFWLIDPIDGTKEFINKSGFFTINFGLVFNNEPVFGIITQPTTSSTWYNYNNKAYKISKSFEINDSKELKPKYIDLSKLNMICSSTNYKSGLKKWLDTIKPIKIEDIGSSLKFCYMAEGKYNIYPRTIPTMEWDTAAGHSILKASGGNIFTSNGLELFYNKQNFKNQNFIAFGKFKKIPPPKYFLENVKNISLYNQEIKDSVKSLKNGNLIVFPTETVYGLGAIGVNEKAISSIYKAKNRPKDNPLIAHFSNINQTEKFVLFTNLAKKLAAKFWPGPLTMVLQINSKNKYAKILSRGRSTLAVRIPSHPIAIDLISKLRHPILAPSANKSGGVSPTSADHVKIDFKKNVGPSWKIAKILDYGKCEIGIESTVIDCRGKNPIILREGFITSEKIEEITNLKVVNKNLSDGLLSPGLLNKHYSPNTKVLINQKKYIVGSGCLSFGELPKDFKNSKHHFNLSLSENLFEASHLLYEGLRYLDKYNLNFIQVLPIPNVGIGKAINDRLKRASFVE